MEAKTFSIDDSIEVLERTPAVLRSMLDGLTYGWTGESSEPDEARAWNPFDVVGHFIHGEKTDWIPRAQIILDQGADRTFVPFDRFAQFEESKGKSLAELLDEFAELRRQNISTLREWRLTEEQLDLEGVHPAFGRVTLRQLLATWVVHDLNHVRQIVVAMAGRYSDAVGPWREYLSILR